MRVCSKAVLFNIFLCISYSSIESGSDTETGMETGSKTPSDNNKQCEDKAQQLPWEEWSEEEISIVMETYTRCSSDGVKKFLNKLHMEKLLQKSPFQVYT